MAPNSKGESEDAGAEDGVASTNVEVGDPPCPFANVVGKTAFVVGEVDPAPPIVAPVVDSVDEVAPLDEVEVVRAFVVVVGAIVVVAAGKNVSIGLYCGAVVPVP